MRCLRRITGIPYFKFLKKESHERGSDVSRADFARLQREALENYLVDLHLKLAFPLICLIVVVIGGALATRLRMQGAALGFGLSVAISFIYYGIMRTGQALGHNGALPPYVAAWSADVLFGAIAVVMITQAQRR